MKNKIVGAALACFVSALTASAALAKDDITLNCTGGAAGGARCQNHGDPISAVGIVIRNGTGIIVQQTQTTPTGVVHFPDLAPGDYVIEIDGRSLIAAMDRLAPTTPARHDSSPSVSLGVGGLFGGGGSHHSDGGAGPIGGSNGGGRDHSSNGGVGLGLSVPIGGGSGSGSNSDNSPRITFTVTLVVSNDPGIIAEAGAGGGPRSIATFSSATPYCRDTAGQGMRIGFKIAENESPRPQDRIVAQSVTLTTTVYVGGASGGVWRSDK